MQLMDNVRMFYHSKKGQLNSLTGLAWGIGLFALIVGVVAIILSKFKGTDAVYNNSVANTTLANALIGVSDMSGYISLIVIIGVMAVILGMVLVAFMGRTGKSR